MLDKGIFQFNKVGHKLVTLAPHPHFCPCLRCIDSFLEVCLLRVSVIDAPFHKKLLPSIGRSFLIDLLLCVFELSLTIHSLFLQIVYFFH